MSPQIFILLMDSYQMGYGKVGLVEGGGSLGTFEGYSLSPKPHTPTFWLWGSEQLSLGFFFGIMVFLACYRPSRSTASQMSFCFWFLQIFCHSNTYVTRHSSPSVPNRCPLALLLIPLLLRDGCSADQCLGHLGMVSGMGDGKTEIWLDPCNSGTIIPQETA